ncbi:MAG: bestrophin-like domain [Actinomycetota bacterium]
MSLVCRQRVTGRHSLDLVWAVLIIVGVTAAMVAAMLLVRRGAPEGSRFQDGDRASGVFGVLSTGFALLLGFVVFLAFTKYDDSRSGAETEALVLMQQFETAQLMPPDAGARLSGELVCYGRSVVEQEWPAMGSGSETDQINPWAVALFRTLETVEPRANSEQSAFDNWLSQTNAREEARRDRLHAAEGIVPLPVWLVLFFSAALIFVYLLFFADSGESAVVQGMMAGSVTAVVVATLLVLAALNRPYQQDIGGLRPVAMQRSLAILDEARATLGIDEPPPCDADGVPT